MKKAQIFMLVALTAILLSSCGNQSKTNAVEIDNSVPEMTESVNSSSAAETPAVTKEDEQVVDSKVESVSENTSSQSVIVEHGEEKWRVFIKEYEAFVDEYIELVKKYKENPADLSILSEYTATATKMAEWTQKSNEVQDELKDTEEALKFSAELLRIAGKLAEAAY